MSQLGARSAAEAVLSAPSARSEAAHDWLAALEEVPLFEGLPKRQLRRIAKLARIRRFAPGSTLVRAGDPGRSFFVLLDGTAKVDRGCGPSLLFRFVLLVLVSSLKVSAPRSASVVADGEVLALTVDRSGFTKLLGAEPALAQTLLRTLAARLRAAETSI
jgi:CRP-like cAMP-binding protein